MCLTIFLPSEETPRSSGMSYILKGPTECISGAHRSEICCLGLLVVLTPPQDAVPPLLSPNFPYGPAPPIGILSGHCPDVPPSGDTTPCRMTGMCVSSKASLRRTVVHGTCDLIFPCSGRDCVKSPRSSYMGLLPQTL